MTRTRSCQLPENALLLQYFEDGTYTDCYRADMDGRVSQVEFVAAFYSTWLFKLERWILGWAVKRPSTDAEALELAQGRRDRFAAWDVERRTEDQLLLCDLHGRTRSWLMTSPDAGDGPGTRLYFGSAVVPRFHADTGKSSLGFTYRALLGFHKLYSRCLLHAACSKLLRRETS